MKPLDRTAKIKASDDPSSHSGFKRFFPARFYDSNFVKEYAKLESLRAARYGSSFSLVLIQIEEHDDAREYANLLKDLSVMTVEVLRNCDVAGMVGERRLLIILPETDYFGSLMAIRKLKKALKKITGGSTPGVVFSQATCPRDGDSYALLIESASQRIEKQKNSLWSRLDLEDRLFWEVIGRLLETHRHEAESSTFDLGPGMELKEDFIEAVNLSLVREIKRNPANRGILYMSTKDLCADMPVLRALRAAGEMASKVFLVTEKKPEWGPGHRGITPIVLDDPRLGDKSFTFFLGEYFAYALIAKQSWQETFFCFHTSDEHLVEGLILKLQRDFSLQEQL